MNALYNIFYMKKLLRNWIFWLLILATITGLGYMFAQYRANRFKVLDRTAFNDFKTEFESTFELGIESQDQLSSFITDWADSNNLEYKTDSAGNIVFNTPAIDRKKSVSPTVIVVGMNSKTAHEKSSLFASAAMLALSDLQSSRKTVIFVNDELASGKGYMSLSNKLISSKSKVIYMDQAAKAYLSVESFAETVSEIKIPVSKEKHELDSAVKVKISGIKTAELGPSISDQPDPVAALASMLSRLKSKSVSYRIADFSIGSNGKMYPDSIEACILINSYSMESFTKFIDQTIKNWNKAYSKSNPDIEFTYEVIDEENQIPSECFDADSSDLITGILYTINSGVYTFTKSDPVPEGKNIGDPCGLNCVTDADVSDSSIKLRLISQGYNEMFLNRIVIDNQAAAELLSCDYSVVESHDAFINEKDSLLRTFKSTYTNVNSTSDNTIIKVSSDNKFTPCSYLSEKNSKADIIHLCLSRKSAAKLTNTLMCYIKAKGNTFTL